jgi:peptide/nickel transport system permease protein
MATSASSRAWARLRANKLAWISASTVLALILAAIFGPSLTGEGPNVISRLTFAPPSLSHPFGTDELGRNVLTQLLYGIRTSLTVGMLAATSAAVIGITIGAIAGFAGGRVESVVMRITEIFQVMPTFILASVIVALAGPGMMRVIAVIAILSWPQTARLMRGEVLRVKTLEFVDAMRCLGIREPAILWFEVVPNAIAPVVALATLIVGQAILLEASLSFFGLTTPDIPSWGLMLNSGQRFYYQAWWLSVFPGLAILITVLAFNIFGDCVSEAFNPRASERK